MRLTLPELAQAIDGTLSGDPALFFEGISIDTRTLQKGSAFFAIKGPRFDGHDFLAAAAQKGAAALIVEHPSNLKIPQIQVRNSLTALQAWGSFVRQRSRAIVFAVGGSNGKTTTKQMLGAIMQGSGKTLVTKGNLNNTIGVPLTLAQLEPDHEYAVIEVGTSWPGEIRQLCEWTRPEIGVVTNVGKDHLKSFKTMDRVIEENAEIFRSLSATGKAIINLDDPWIKPLVNSLKVSVLTFSMLAEADVYATDIREAAQSCQFILHVGADARAVTLPVPGRFQVANAVAAAAAASAAGLSMDAIVKGLTSFSPAPMRMQLLKSSKGAILINDAYNANPSSVQAAVESLINGYPTQRKFVVLGDMRDLGEVSHAEHLAMGRWLSDKSLSGLYLYGRECRFAEASLSNTAPFPYKRFKKKCLLFEKLRREIQKDDVVLFKGSRAMKLEQLIGALS